MQFAHEKLQGLDRERVLDTVVPVLRAHGVDGVELVWRSDGRGWVLYLTVERAGATEPEAGVSLDLCAEISRDLSAALDVADVIPGRYRLEVGTPGLDRALYSAADYARFRGRTAKVKLRQPRDGQKVLRGVLRGLDGAGHVLVDVDGHDVAVPAEDISEGQLIFDWRPKGGGNGAATTRRRKKPSHRSR